MTELSDVLDIGRLIPFTIDGTRYETDQVRQRAAALVRLAGLDPAAFDLGEIKGNDSRRTRRYNDDDVVTIRKGARFVTIRQSAPVA